MSVPLPQKVCSEKHRRNDSVELTLRVSKDLYAKLRKVKELYSHIEASGGCTARDAEFKQSAEAQRQKTD